MCHPTRCRTCNGTTWAGCGQHVDQVLARVPRDARCTCEPDDDGRPPRAASLLDRLFGR